MCECDKLNEMQHDSFFEGRFVHKDGLDQFQEIDQKIIRCNLNYIDYCNDNIYKLNDSF